VAEPNGGAHGELTLTGQILIPASASAIERGVASIQLEEIAGEDAPARVIAETKITDVRHKPGGDTVIPFALRLAGDLMNSRGDYALRVWVDHDGNGQRSSGDLFSTERHRVSTSDAPAPIVIKVGR
jgi:uncharacterized lipoprotein YbaY